MWTVGLGNLMGEKGVKPSPTLPYAFQMPSHQAISCDIIVIRSHLWNLKINQNPLLWTTHT